jgi:hypothetical protein
VEAFTKYWFALLDYGFQTGKLDEWSRLSASGCVFCSDLKTGITSDYKDGAWLVGGRMQTPSVEAVTAPSEPVQKVTVQVLQTAATSYNADGSKGDKSGTAGNSAVVVLAVYKAGAWSVSDMHPLR